MSWIASRFPLPYNEHRTSKQIHVNSNGCCITSEIKMAIVLPWWKLLCIFPINRCSKISKNFLCPINYMTKWRVLRKTKCNVAAYLESKNSINSKICEVVFVLRENFGAQCCSGNIQQILSKFCRVTPCENQRRTLLFRKNSWSTKWWLIKHLTHIRSDSGEYIQSELC